MTTVERIPQLDALRGLALLGILLGNVPVFAGVQLVTAEMLAEMGDLTLNKSIEYWLEVFVKAKFYSLFSLLFGIGVALQIKNTKSYSVGRAYHFRRMYILALIGLVHAVLIWFGDILLLYALLGLCLLWFWKFSDRVLLATALLLLLSPIVLYGVYMSVGFVDVLASADSLGLPEDNPYFVAYQRGGYGDVFIANAEYLVGRWYYIFVEFRIPRVLGMFLLGMYLVRSNLLFFILQRMKQKMILVITIGSFLLGIILNTLYMEAHEAGPFLPPSNHGLQQIIFSVFGVPILMFAYIGVLVIVYRYLRLKLLEYLGRMALTNYLLQSLICVLIFYGYGLGYYGRVNYANILFVTALVFVLQLVFSAWYLSRFSQGPMERLWRKWASRSMAVKGMRKG